MRISFVQLHTLFLLSLQPLVSHAGCCFFLNDIDEFYDRRVKLILSAAAPATALYRGERLKHDFLRTQSRLQEMQSRNYLGEAHKP